MAEIGMQYPVWAEMVTESTYGTGLVIGKAVSANLSWQKEDNELRADDAVAETDTSITGFCWILRRSPTCFLTAPTRRRTSPGSIAR